MIRIKVKKKELKRFFVERFYLILLIYIFVATNILIMYDRYRQLHTSVPSAQESSESYIVEFDAREIVLDDISKVYRQEKHFRLRIYTYNGLKKAIIEPVATKTLVIDR